MDWSRRKSLFLLVIFSEPFRNPFQIIGFPIWGNKSIYLIMDLASALELAADCLGDQQLTGWAIKAGRKAADDLALQCLGRGPSEPYVHGLNALGGLDNLLLNANDVGTAYIARLRGHHGKKLLRLRLIEVRQGRVDLGLLLFQ